MTSSGLISNSVSRKGPVTTEEWPKIHCAFSRHPGRQDHDYSNLSKVPGFMEGFKSWDSGTQHQFMRWYFAGLSCKLLTVVIDLRDQVTVEYPGTYWATSTLSLLRDYTTHWHHAWTESHGDLIEKFGDFQFESEIPEPFMFLEMSITSAHLLSMLYGHERVSEVITAWIDNTVSRDLNHFVEVVEKWNVLKSYPIDWTLSTFD